MDHVRRPDLFAQVLVNRRSVLRRLVVKPHQGGRDAGESEQIREDFPRFPVGNADPIAQIDGRGLRNRSDAKVLGTLFLSMLYVLVLPLRSFDRMSDA